MNLSGLLTVRFDLINFLLVSIADIFLLSRVLVVAHVLHQLGVSLLRHQLFVLVRSKPVPVRKLKKLLISFQVSSYILQSIITSFPSSSTSRCVANGSRCSWSRYFSRLKKVSKKTGVILHLFKSCSVIWFLVAGRIISNIWLTKKYQN